MNYFNLLPIKSSKGEVRPKRSNRVSKTISLSVGVLAMVFLIAFIVWAWTEPGVAPPGGNVQTPINVSLTDQTKAGGLGVKFLSISSANNDKIILYGTQVDPHTIWLGDSKGIRFWDSINGELMRITNTGDIGIGTIAPEQKLHVVGTGRLERVSTRYLDTVGSNMRVGTNRADDGTYEWFGWYSGGSRAGIFLWDGVWSGCDAGKFCIFGDTHQLMLKSRTGNVIIDDTLEITGNLDVQGGKLTVDTIDPIFEIDERKYATYVADFAGGVRVETSGVVKLEDEKYVIAFDNLEKGSDLWLFWQISNKTLSDVGVLLTPSFEGKAWYKKNGNTLTIYGDKVGEVSYRLSVPRIDYEEWGNLANSQDLEGIIVSEY